MCVIFTLTSINEALRLDLIWYTIDLMKKIKSNGSIQLEWAASRVNVPAYLWKLWELAGRICIPQHHANSLFYMYFHNSTSSLFSDTTIFVSSLLLDLHIFVQRCYIYLSEAVETCYLSLGLDWDILSRHHITVLNCNIKGCGKRLGQNDKNKMKPWKVILPSSRILLVRCILRRNRCGNTDLDLVRNSDCHIADCTTVSSLDANQMLIFVIVRIN